MIDPVLAVLLRQLELAFDARSWHGTNLLGSLRGLKGDVLLWRPQPRRHNIAELALHAAYWKYRAYRLISDEPPRSFELEGSDFFARSELTEAQWKEDLALLRCWHERLHEAVSGLDPACLERPSRRRGHSWAELVCGFAAHDLYHAGQIQLLKRLHENAPVRHR